MGTPKTLLKAIETGMWTAASTNSPMPEGIERNVRDYLDQALATMSAEGHEVAVKRFLELISAKKKEVALNRAA